LIVIANLAATVIAPSSAISDIGVNGLYGQKNLAGIVAMIAAVVGFGWLLGARSARGVARGSLALLVIFAFLLLTRSKTSINLTVLGVSLMSSFALAEHFGARFILAAISMLLLAAAVLLVAFAAVDFDFNAALNAVIADATFTGRDQLWAFAGSEAHKRYWWGHGYGAFWDVGYANDPILRVETGSWLASTGVGVINQAHNGYIELWLELGLPAAVVAGLTTFKGAVVGGYRAVFGVGSRQDRAALGALAVLLLLQLFHNLTEATLFMRGMTFSSIAALALFAIALPQKPSDASTGRRGL
jgi:exopolysaccharide production protein ExoQ